MASCSFKPAWWLKNPHAQTIWPTLSGRHEDVPLKKQVVDLPDGDFIELLWDQSNCDHRSKPIVLMLHGLGGNVRSPYAKGLMGAISKCGWRPVFMHFRGSSGQPNRLDRCYHSGDTDDLAYVVHLLLEQSPSVGALGVSLGGGVLLKWLGETGDDNPLRAASAVSVPFELHHAATHVNKGFSQFYQYWLLRTLRNNLNAKFAKRDCPFDLNEVNALNTFWDFDDAVTAPLHGFKDAEDYYDQSSCRQFLSDIERPTLIIHSEDDPFMPTHVIPKTDELSHCTRLEVSDHGGHVGFVSGERFGVAEYWLERRIPEFFKDFF